MPKTVYHLSGSVNCIRGDTPDSYGIAVQVTAVPVPVGHTDDAPVSYHCDDAESCAMAVMMLDIISDGIKKKLDGTLDDVLSQFIGVLLKGDVD